MPNKLKDIFSDKMFDLEGVIRFQDNGSYQKFLEKLQMVWDDGEPTEIEGVSSITTMIKDGGQKYPISEMGKLTRVMVYPSAEDIPIVMDTAYGERTLVFKLYHTQNETVLETDKNEVIYFKIVFIKNSSNIRFTYTQQPQFAKTIEAIIMSCNTSIAFINKVFKGESNLDGSEENDLLCKARKSLQESEAFFQRLHLVEQELGVSFNPTQINSAESDQKEAEELYLLLIDKKVIRLNAKLNATESTGMTLESKSHMLKVGANIDLSYIGKSEYLIYGQKSIIHTANLLSKAIVKEIKKNEDGTTKIMYGDIDSQPMYISYTGFKTVDEAMQEMKIIMNHKEKYTDALTLHEYMIKTNDKMGT